MPTALRSASIVILLGVLASGCVDYGIPDELFACRAGPTAQSECGEGYGCARGQGCYCLCGKMEMLCSKRGPNGHFPPCSPTVPCADGGACTLKPDVEKTEPLTDCADEPCQIPD